MPIMCGEVSTHCDICGKQIHVIHSPFNKMSSIQQNEHICCHCKFGTYKIRQHNQCPYSMHHLKVTHCHLKARSLLK
jgi:hypothetical protein